MSPSGYGTAEYVDLFAGGAAGWEVAGRRLGLPAMLGVETDEDSCLTREAAGLLTLRGDVSELTPWQGIIGLCGSPPCQAWSRAGKRLGLQDQPLVYGAVDVIVSGRDVWQRLGELRQRCADDRSLLVVEPLRWALAALPEWVALEQVPDVLEVWQRIGVELERCGYRVWSGVLNAANFGVPQTRERAILIASRSRKVGPPAPTHSDQRRGQCLLGLTPWVSMAQALSWDDGPERPARTVCGDRSPRWAYGQGNSYGTGWTLETGQQSQLGGGRMVRYRRSSSEPAPTVDAQPGWQRVLDTRRDQREDGETHQRVETDRPAPSLTGKSGGQLLWRNGNQANAAERRLDEPAPTVHFGHNLNQVGWVSERPATTVQATPRISRPGHKDRDHGEAQFQQDVAPVTPQEAAILQDLDPDWPFHGTKTSVFRQIGNAIPPGLASAILREAAGIEREEEAA